ncbi:small integral membrane protein 30 [Pantherophis guttatus]|uniref:Small integral membrane protein 30 n=1 Tax=Pantherophis guttatus TaxID=94885 RepID=A0A6P9CUS6_PANGU|nr:small integral membrane protein 30 [Pantherophis guttatus]XP_034286902.1 small integral membrane protein 30 [Pantherophis guttatus]XP_034286903.1 small integral membrane protein 30 [Pantherophis guttatus]XP_034286904.1 small integral membrane protein 30 [Pantherophis guttatus]XP_058046607.1 small integral membrane protein 30 [Ahaetulla prasina]XP_058046608.1 small integral membrane protein 30 [Ahaetulla prasina]XP_058046609.1 small integral membrane protein 30 [Ahaetulla prasina]
MTGNMATTRNASQLFLVFFLLLFCLPVVEALDMGDALALLLGVALSCVGFCACLGLYARRRHGEQ